MPQKTIERVFYPKSHSKTLKITYTWLHSKIKGRERLKKLFKLKPISSKNERDTD